MCVWVCVCVCVCTYMLTHVCVTCTLKHTHVDHIHAHTHNFAYKHLCIQWDMHARIDTKRYLKLSRQEKKLCGTPEGPEAKFPDSHFKDLLLPNLDSVFPFVSLCVYANFVRVHIHYYSREYACMYTSYYTHVHIKHTCTYQTHMYISNTHHITHMYISHHITHTFENIHI